MSWSSVGLFVCQSLICLAVRPSVRPSVSQSRSLLNASPCKNRRWLWRGANALIVRCNSLYTAFNTYTQSTSVYKIQSQSVSHSVCHSFIQWASRTFSPKRNQPTRLEERKHWKSPGQKPNSAGTPNHQSVSQSVSQLVSQLLSSISSSKLFLSSCTIQYNTINFILIRKYMLISPNAKW